jgi:hypothetical protein
MPQTEQVKRQLPGQDLSEVNSKARSTEFDLSETTSRTRVGTWGDECTFTVEKRGNKVTEKGNY